MDRGVLKSSGLISAFEGLEKERGGAVKTVEDVLEWSVLAAAIKEGVVSSTTACCTCCSKTNNGHEICCFCSGGFAELFLCILSVTHHKKLSTKREVVWNMFSS